MNSSPAHDKSRERDFLFLTKTNPNTSSAANTVLRPLSECTKKASLSKLVNLQSEAFVGLRQKKSLKIAICHLCLT